MIGLPQIEVDFFGKQKQRKGVGRERVGIRFRNKQNN